MAVAGSLTYDTKIDRSGFEKGLKEMEGSVKTGGSKIKDIVSALGITKLISTAINIINNSIDGAVSRIDTMNNFPKVMSNLGIASQDSEKAIKKLSDGLQGIPTTLDSAALAVQRFTSKNGDVDKSVDLFLAVNNALLAGGASADIQSSAMEQLSQAYSKGKPDMVEWRAIQTAMPAQLKQISKEILGNKDSLDKYLKKAKEYAKKNPMNSAAKEMVQQFEDVKKGTGDMTTALGSALRTGIISMDDFMDVIIKMNKQGSGEFQSFEKQAKNATGGIKTSITNAKTAITRGVSNIIKAFDEMLRSNGLGGLSVVISNIGKISEKVLNNIASLIPKVISKVKDIYNWVMNNQIAVEALVGVVSSLIAGYLAYKAVLIAINAIQTVKNITGTITAFLSLIPTIRSAKDAMLLLNMAFSANPVGLVVAGVVALIGILGTLAVTMNDTNKKTKVTFENMGKGASDFVTGISTAKSHLEDFNSTLFASAEEQQDLKKQMDEVQAGITSICKTASDERRQYTQQEITQLDEYFQKLRELNEREIQIQQSISQAITQQAVTNAQTFQGSLEEYKIQSQEWLNTAEQQKIKTIELINQQSIEEVALLNQRYGDQANMQNEAYANEYNEIQRQKEEKITQANDEIAQIQQAYSDGYLERSKQENGWYQKVQEVNKKLENENNRYTESVKATKESEVLTEGEKNLQLLRSKSNHNDKVQKIWKEMYRGMSKEQANELGVWLAMLSQTEMYGGDISQENKDMVDEILKSYDNMPKETREAMKNAMSPMLTEMEKKEPSLFAKATGIAEGILSRLNKSFDIHSPSKKTRKIFNYVMQGSELGLDDEKDKLMKQVDEISESVIRKMQNAVAIETGSISAKAILQSNKEQPIVIARDHTVHIDNTQNFYEKNTTPYEQQKQAKQQLRRVAYGI